MLLPENLRGWGGVSSPLPFPEREREKWSTGGMKRGGGVYERHTLGGMFSIILSTTGAHIVLIEHNKLKKRIVVY